MTACSRWWSEATPPEPAPDSAIDPGRGRSPQRHVSPWRQCRAILCPLRPLWPSNRRPSSPDAEDLATKDTKNTNGTEASDIRPHALAAQRRPVPCQNRNVEVTDLTPLPYTGRSDAVNRRAARTGGRGSPGARPSSGAVSKPQRKAAYSHAAAAGGRRHGVPASAGGGLGTSGAHEVPRRPVPANGTPPEGGTPCVASGALETPLRLGHPKRRGAPPPMLRASPPIHPRGMAACRRWWSEATPPEPGPDSAIDPGRGRSPRRHVSPGRQCRAILCPLRPLWPLTSDHPAPMPWIEPQRTQRTQKGLMRPHPHLPPSPPTDARCLGLASKNWTVKRGGFSVRIVARTGLGRGSPGRCGGAGCYRSGRCSRRSAGVRRRGSGNASGTRDRA